MAWGLTSELTGAAGSGLLELAGCRRVRRRTNRYDSRSGLSNYRESDRNHRSKSQIECQFSQSTDVESAAWPNWIAVPINVEVARQRAENGFYQMPLLVIEA